MTVPIPEDYKFLDKTRDGHPITDVFQDPYGYLAIVFKRDRPNGEKDWCTATYYDPANGWWSGQGMYGLGSRQEAIENLIGRVEGRMNEFDPTNFLDVRHEYNAQYNWNNVSKRYLMENSHRSPDFDTFYYRTEAEKYEHPFDNHGDWEAYKRDVYRKRNSPSRVGSYNILGGKYAERRQALKFWEGKR